MTQIYAVPGLPVVAIQSAIEAARRSPCVKSKRGACVFLPAALPIPEGGAVVNFSVSDHNGPPKGVGCLRNEMCARDCGQRCVHAEGRAVRLAVENDAQRTWGSSMLSKMEVVHVKVDMGGDLVAGGAPSCVTCSREILDVGLHSVWLFEHGMPARKQGDFTCRTCSERGDINSVRYFENRAMCPVCGNMEVTTRLHGIIKPQDTKTGTWKRYTAAAFHVETCKNLGIV